MKTYIRAEAFYQPDDDDFRRAGVGPRYSGANLAVLPDSRPYVRALRAWARDVAQHIRAGDGLLLYGPMGSGKTCASVCLIRAVLEHGGTALKVTATNLVKLEVENPPFDDTYSMRTRIEMVDLLVIDDVGAAYESAFGKVTLERIIRGRLEECRSVVMSTNLEKDQFENAVGESAAHAMLESVVPLEISGVDWRTPQAKKMAASLATSLEPEVPH